MKANFFRFTLTFAIALSLFGANLVQSAPGEGDKGAATDNAAAAQQAPAAAPAKDAVTTSAANACLSDPVVLNEIAKKQQEIEARQKELQSKEAELKARETAINDELKSLQALRDQIAGIESAQSQANQDKVAKVIETLQNMSPKASAQMLTTLDDGLAVSAISQMDSVKLAKIMNIMDPKRAAKLTELLAGVVRARSTASSGAAETTASGAEVTSPSVASRKGEQANDTSNKPESIISGGPDLAAKTQ